MSNQSDAATKTRWGRDEHMALAKVAIERFPKRGYANATRVEDLSFTIAEFDIIQHHALPKERWRAVRTSQHLAAPRRNMLEAIVELRGGAVVVVSDPVSKGRAAQIGRTPKGRASRANPVVAVSGNIVWDDAEWKLFAHQLHTMNPELHLLNSVDLAGLTTGHLNRAALVMAKDRKRTFHALEATTKRLLEVYRQARAVRDELFYPKLELPTKHALTPRQERMFKRAPAPVPETPKEFTVNPHKSAVVVPAPPPPVATKPAAPKPPPLTVVPAVAKLPKVRAASGASRAIKGRIDWTRDEWMLLAIELQREFPHATVKDNLAALSTPAVVRAQRKVLPAERHRSSLAKAYFKRALMPYLVTAFQDLANGLVPEPAAQKAAPVVAAVAQPAHTPPVTIPGTSAPPKGVAAPIRWTDVEWLAIATELHSIYPKLKLLDNVELHGLTSPDVALAQRVLAPHLQRPNLKINTFKKVFKPHLLRAFKALKAQLAKPASSEAAKAVDAAVVSAVAKVGSIAPAPVAPVAKVVPLAALVPVGEVNPYEAALKPLVDLLVSQLAAQLQPMLAKVIQAAGAAVLAAVPPPPPEPSQPPKPSPFGAIFHPEKPRAPTTVLKEPPPLNPSPAGPSLINYALREPLASSAPRPLKPRIGVVGGLANPAHRTELIQEFPDIEFVCVDTAKQLTSVRNCDKVIGMTKFASHTMTGKAKKIVKERWVPIDGGISEMKRMIGIWIASGILPGMPKQLVAV